MVQSLNGLWQVGVNRQYDRNAQVPGMVYPADKVPEGNVWYQRKIQLTQEHFEHAALVLHGAKYAPTVYINGTKVANAEGGLAPTVHLLTHKAVQPGAEILLEICLQNLETMDQEDASYLPVSDQWRSNLTSHLWDDVELVFYNSVRIDRLMPEYVDGEYYIRYKAVMDNPIEEAGVTICMRLYDGSRCVGQYDGTCCNGYGRAKLALSEDITLWAPDSPKLYTLRCEVDGTVWEQSIGFKKLEIVNKHFKLNGEPIVLRMSTIVWHRAYRDIQFQGVAYDTEWFYEEVIKRLKRYGVNTLRFHLGNPPKRILELCDKYGLLTQMEWSFFHDAVASTDSMAKQYEDWIGICLEHPATAIIHPWNEVDDESRHANMIRAAEASQNYFPKYIMSHRDVIHIHAYWWSLFENLGLYYDSFEQFDKPVIADEFGGNYLDYDGEYGGYPTVRDAMQRFLGAAADKKEARIWLNTMSNGKIAEYWRRINVAGYSPFCMISSPEDGNTHFFGTLKNPIEMPVWEALKPAYYPVAVSMDIWDRHFEPEEQVKVPLHLFNDTAQAQKVTVELYCKEKDMVHFYEAFGIVIPAFSKVIEEKVFVMPKQAGAYRMSAAVGDAVSVWDVCVHKLEIENSTESVKGQKLVGILSQEKELAEFLAEYKIAYTTDWSVCDVILGMHATYEALKYDNKLCEILKKHVCNGKKAVILGCGPARLDSRQDDSVHFPFRKRSLAALEEITLFDDLILRFAAFPEGESHVHPDDWQKQYWQHIPKEGFSLWNGLRGGLIVPAVNMEVEGVSAEAFAELWANRGADIHKIKQAKSYCAYECMGLYEFGEDKSPAVKERLMERVNFLLADAPALKTGNQVPQMTEYNLSEAYAAYEDNGNRCIPLLHAGKGFKRIPAMEIQYGAGILIVAQLMTDGRLTGKAEAKRADDSEASIGYLRMTNTHRDPLVRQLVLNLLG